MKAFIIGAALVGVLIAAGHATQVSADGARFGKTLRVNSGTRVKPPNQYEGSIQEVAFGFGAQGPGMTGAAFVRVSGPKGIPQCVIHLGSFAEAMTLAQLIQSDKLKSISCIDERVPQPTVIIHFPPDPVDQSACPRLPGCTGQQVDFESYP